MDLQIKGGFQFESETDTETIPKLLKMIYDSRTDDDLAFRELVELAVQQLVSRYWTSTQFWCCIVKQTEPVHMFMHIHCCVCNDYSDPVWEYHDRWYYT